MNRFKNVWFYIGIVGVFLTAIGVKPESLTSWDAVIAMLKAFINNPYMLGTALMAIIGVIVDPTTPGFKDGE